MSDQKRAAIYARTAISPQRGPHFPMAQQIQECQAYAASEGYEVVEEFEEVSSGSSLDRPILQSLLQAAKEGRFEAVILPTFERLSRRQSRHPSSLPHVKETEEESSALLGRFFLAKLMRRFKRGLPLLRKRELKLRGKRLLHADEQQDGQSAQRHRKERTLYPAKIVRRASQLCGRQFKGL